MLEENKSLNLSGDIRLPSIKPKKEKPILKEIDLSNKAKPKVIKKPKKQANKNDAFPDFEFEEPPPDVVYTEKPIKNDDEFWNYYNNN